MNKLRRLGLSGGWGRGAAMAAAVLLILGMGFFPLTAQRAGQEDPLSVIQKHGTAGMRLQGDKVIEVRDNKIFVRSGQTVRALFDDKAQFFVGKNTSKLATADMRRLALEAVQTHLAGPFNQSYKVHSSYELKSESGERKTVIARFVFEHRNIWFAEERTLELDITSRGTAHTLTGTRAVSAPPVKLRGALKTKVTAGPALQVRRATDFSATKQASYKIDKTVTGTISKKYASFQAVPIHDLSRIINRPVVSFGPTAKGLANTAYPEVVTAEEATDQVHLLMQTALGTATKYIGPDQSSKNNILNYLKNDTNLVAWNNIGHGGTSTLFQNGTEIYDTDFAIPANFHGLNGCVCLVNACQTFNDPLKAAILACGPRVYIAGVINLPMVTSEGSNPNFWFKVLFEGKAMSVAYSETNTEAGLNGYWGFWGDSGVF